jgi:mRNA degradation ribonuclease J1/J2
MDRSKKLVSKGVAGASTKSKDWEEKKKKIERDLERFLYKETGKSPLIMVHTIAV